MASKHGIIARLLEDLEREGWRIEGGDRGHHVKAFPPDRTQSHVTISCSPGRGNWQKALRASLRQRGYMGNVYQ